MSNPDAFKAETIEWRPAKAFPDCWFGAIEKDFA
jgi:hypothetical protein